MADSKSSFIVFSGTCTQYLTEKICQNLNMPMGNMQVTRFSDGEVEYADYSDDSDGSRAL